jgi:hypothetical protein
MTEGFRMNGIDPRLIDEVLCDLNSEKTESFFEDSCYWPKWDGPWWKIRLLSEMGLTFEIPGRALDALVQSLDRMPFKIFPITPEEVEGIVNPFNDTCCHCQLGTMYSVLSEAKRDVSAELPWMRRWLSSYQMPDGGYNCDESAYLVEGECPSSMVATIAIFEALLAIGPEQWVEAERTAAERAAKFLVSRRLTLGSQTQHNSSEQAESKAWSQLCFPRFYHYDILRGLSALTRYSSLTGFAIPEDLLLSIAAQMEVKKDPKTGMLLNERPCFFDHGTIRKSPDGTWSNLVPASEFTLLQAVSKVGDPSPFLTKEWNDLNEKIQTLRRPTPMTS